MKIINRILLSIICIINSMFLTLQVSKCTLTTSLQYVFVFIYFLAVGGVVILFTRKYFVNIFSKKEKKVAILISIVIGLFISISCVNIFSKFYQDTTIILQPSFNSKEFIEEESIWISDIYIDGESVPLSNYQIPNGWSYNSEWNDIISKDANAKSLILKFPKSKSIQIRFAYYNKFAKTTYIKDGNSAKKLIKLETYDKESYIYKVKSNIKDTHNLLGYFVDVSSFIFCSSLIYLVICLCQKKKMFYIIFYLILYYCIYNANNNILTSNSIPKGILLVISLIVGFIFINIISDEKIKEYNTLGTKIIIMLVSLYSAFASIGYNLFLNKESVNITLNGICILLLCALWFLPIIINILYLLECISHKFNKMNMVDRNSTSIIKASIMVFLSMFLVWEIVLVGFFPGNLTPDSIDQWSQAVGMTEISNWHPAFDTILIRILIQIIKSPFWVLSVQIFLSSLILTSLFMIVYKSGLKLKWVCLMAFIFAILPNNSLFIITLWKDIPYTMSLLWLTYLIGKVLKAPTVFLNKKYNYILLPLSIIGVKYFRHNGVIPFYLTIIFLLYLTIKNYKKIKLRAVYIILFTLVLSVLIEGPVYRIFKVKTGAEEKPYTTMFTALGSAISKDCTFSEETTKTITGIMPIEDWKQYYNRFNSDSYIYDREGGMNLSKISANEAFRSYLEGLIKYPGVIIKDRLDGMNLLWDVTQPMESFNYRYSMGIGFPKGFSPSLFGVEYTDKSNQLYLPDNIITKTISLFTNNIIKYPFIDSLLFRSGIYLIFYLILIIFALKNKISKIWWISIPFLGNTASWILLMSHQSYRYIYYIAPCVWVICIMIITEKSKLIGKTVNDL